MTESLFNKIAGLRPATLLKKETLVQVFVETFGRLFLSELSETSKIKLSAKLVNGLKLN